MTNEKWWDGEEYAKLYAGQEFCLVHDMDKIVAEAMRLGEVKAWSAASLMLKDVKQKFRCAACDGASNLSHTHTCSAFAEIEAKLTELKK